MKPVTLLKLLSAPIKRKAENLKYWALAKESGLPLYRFPDSHIRSQELAFQEIFRQLQTQLEWLPTSLYPVGGAASISLLCTLVRFLGEHNPKVVIEFGAGQSTRILSSWSRVSGGKVFTVEHDAAWAARCKQTLAHAGHQIVYAPLEKTANGHDWYSWNALNSVWEGNKASLILVDGPIGTKEWSRAGVLENMPGLHDAEFAVMWDDLDRTPDLQSFAKLATDLRTRGLPLDFHFCQAFRTFGMAFTPAFQTLKFYS